MKKLFLLMFAVCLSVAVNAKTPEEIAAQAVRVENNRVGGTLTEDQLSKITKIYVDYNVAEYADASDKKKALGVANKAAQALLTPEQAAARAEYFKKLKEKNAAK